MDKKQAREISAVGFGVLAFALGAAAALGVIRQPDGRMADNVPLFAVAGLVAGVVGLYVGSLNGIGRQVCVIGTGMAMLGLALFGGAIALEAILDSL